MATASMRMDGRSILSKIMKFSLYSFLFLVCQIHQNEGKECMLGHYNVTLLANYNPWESSGPNKNVTYKISLCETVQLCPPNTAVCQLTKGGSSISVGNFTNHVNTSTDNEEGDLVASFRGETCPEMPTEYQTTIIFFKCGKSMGSPVYLGSFGCAVTFEWESHVFCTEKNDVPEVPCHVYFNNEKHDLSPLTMVNGAYLVDSSESRQFYINVCRDITGVNTDSSNKCPPGSGACMIKDGKGIDMGRPTDRLQKTVDGNLMLQYRSLTKPENCVDNPTTTITFICPSRGGSKDPLLIEDRLCHNLIEWQTEYACSETTLTSHTCQLTQEQHNIDLDLSPLRNPLAADHPYKMNVTDGSDHYIYVLNVCDKLGIECPKTEANAASCQLKEHESSFAKNLGKSDRMTLRMSDNELTLSYKDGSPCHTHFRRNTVITFKCNRDAANDGRGYPVYVKAEECTYLFEWETKYACENHPTQGFCRVNHNQHRYDLSALIREDGGNWVALDGEKQSNNDRYYINVCKDVLSSTDTAGCSSTSVCKIDSDGKVKNLGQYTQVPNYDEQSKTIQINYTNGDPCGSGGKTSSRITFICKPGDLETGPVLVHRTDNECVYEFEWHTAAACVLSRKTGTDCKVADKDAGYSFDLSPLMKPRGQYYNVTDTDKHYSFLLNVCGEVSGTQCDNRHTNTAACQVPHDNSPVHKTGSVSKNLIYFDGMINLTYSDGDTYNNPTHTPRQTQIAFLCDPSAGAGHPEFAMETNFTYSFKWYTAYACPTRPVECVFVDKVNNRQYDLSSLSMPESADNWEVVDQEAPHNRHKFYINVCRPVNPIHISTGGVCSPSAAVCETALVDGKETLVKGNLGEARSGPVLDGDHPGQLLLRYSGGQSCVDEDGKNTTYTTLIHFDCLKGSVSTGPLSMIKTSLCEYTTIWRIEAACPVDDVEASLADCRFKDPNSDFTFNLKPLMKKNEGFYTSTSADKTRTFRLNICGNVSTSNCDKLNPENIKSSVCESQTEGHNPGLAMYSGNLEYSNDGQLTLTYGGHRLVSGQLVQVKIDFVCRRDVEDEKPVFVRQGDQTYYFKFETALACAPQPVDCVAFDKDGNRYDLNALAKTSSNWMVQDNREGHSNLKYYINVCRPMSPVPGSKCPGGPVGGCQEGDQSFSLGYVQSKPVVGADGSVVLRYRGGTLCHKGTDKESHRSTRINFICSHVESDPVFMGETETCEYLFEWRTPSACPQQQVVGTGCKVTDPVYNMEFDLSALRKQGGDYRVTAGDYVFLLNACGELETGAVDCAGGNGVGACQTKTADPSYHVNAGKANGNLIYNAGEITLRYTDGKGNCHHKYNRTTIITFTCDHSTDGFSGPRYLREDGDCTYQFEWATSYACPPYTIADCMITALDGKMYDLSSLARNDDNYVDTEPYKGKQFILNVCQTLVHKKGQTCPPNSAACMIDLNQTDPKKKFHKIGEVLNKPLRIEYGNLILRYEHGEPCQFGNRSVSTAVIMNCDPNVRDSEPGGHFMANGCEHHFVWTTQAACPVGGQSTPVQTGNCTVTNPSTGFTFDLSVFNKAAGYLFQDSTTHHDFRLNVCGPLADSPCGKNVGSCQIETAGEKRSFSAGTANSKLEYRGGFLMLNYSGGAPCHQKKFQRGTIINFICQQSAGEGQPVLVEESNDCVYQFNWHTSRVCEKEILCSTEVQGAKGNYTVDLSPLMKTAGHYAAVSMLAGQQDPHTMYYINVCGPLNPISGKSCPPGSSACMITEDKKPVSLGRLASRPSVDPLTRKVTLVYVNGSKCDSDPSKNRTTRIIFSCQVGSNIGEPKFEAVTLDCEYIFMWFTYLACQDDQEKYTPACTYTNPRTDQKYDLSALKDPITVEAPSGGHYKLQACGMMTKPPSTECAGAANCLVNGDKILSYGATKTGIFMMESQEILKLMFTSGSKCTDSLGRVVNAKTEVLFQCDYSADKGKPKHWPSSQCTAVFLWKTNVVCPAVVEQCSLTHGGNLYDLEILSRESESWSHTDSKGNIYYLNICQGVHGTARGEGCHIDAAVCRKSTNKIVDTLGVVRTQKLYVNEKENLVLEYSQGEAACSRGRRRSNNPLAKTVIRFICDNMIGGPQLIEKPENEEKCLFEFEWRTRIACKVGSSAQAVKDTNGVVIDPRSQGAIDLKKFYSSHVNHAAYEKTSRDKIWYAISIDGQLQLDKSHGGSDTCLGAAVCQEKRDDMEFHRNLGAFTSRQYYFKDDKLEVVYTSTEKCKDSKGHARNKNVTSAIMFNCDIFKNQSEPMFSYKSRDCFYLFNWDTNVVCISPKVQVLAASVAGTVNSPVSAPGISGVKPKTVGIVISVFLSVIVLCIILVVFHKPERRAAFASRVKRTFRCHGNTERQIKYSMLTQDDADPEIDEDFFMDHDNDNDITTLPNTSTDNTLQTRAQVRTYHDSSDDDMLE